MLDLLGLGGTAPVLTSRLNAIKFVYVRLARSILVAVVVFSFGVYVFDCEAMTTPEQAMQCCGSMPCSPHGHDGQDCCKSMPTMHAPFVKPSIVQQVSFLVVAALPAVNRVLTAASSQRIPTIVSQAPPIFSPPIVAPLRV